MTFILPIIGETGDVSDLEMGGGTKGCIDQVLVLKEFVKKYREKEGVA